MSLLTVYVLTALTTTVAGVVSGWWLRSRGARPDEIPVSEDNVRFARELFGHLQKLASGVAVELGEHNTRVEAINEELHADGFQEPAKILNVVTRLVDANKTMQGRLDQAEDRLREKVRLVESHTAEARTDALTLVGNRRAFDSDIEQCVGEYRRSGQVFSMAMIDLDKFKRLNDTYGHQAGDEVLRGTGRVLRRVLREGELIARYGGEEFAVIFRRTSPAEAQKALNRLRKAIARHEFEVAGQKLPVTISIGAAQVAGDEDVSRLVERADAALYASKEAGRNCGHWHDGAKCVLIADEAPQPPAAAPAPAPKQAVPSPLPEPADEAPSEMPALPASLPNGLPELLNRTAFFQHVRGRVAEWKRGGPPLSLVLVDIDRFNAITRAHGPNVREMLATCLTRVVAAGTRDMDMVARYSASCLAFLLPKARLPEALMVAERVREAASQVSLAVDGRRVQFTVSVGLIEIGGADDMVTLFRNAELALDAGQQDGGNCIFYHDGQHCQPAAAGVGAAPS